MSKDFFKQKADSYEQNSQRVNNVKNIADAILARVSFKSDMNIMDFGSGTGLLLEQVAPYVKHITAVDISKSMNEQLSNKRDDLECELELIEMDLTQVDLNRTFDGIISSMTMHHIEDVPAMFDKFSSMLNKGGFIAIADLETEDGSFHTEDTGVFHFGFSREQLEGFAKEAGFERVEVTQASVAQKPYGDFPILLLTAFVCALP